MSSQLAVRPEFSYSELELIAGSMSKSGYFADASQQAQAIVKILAGREMGFGPFASMTGVYIISGRPSISANLMASAVKRSGRYDYRVVEMTDKNCTLEFTQGGKVVGTSTFSLDDAKRAGTKNLDKFPRNMLFARSMSNGVRWFCPDVFDGSAVYTPEELGANVNEEGQIIDGKVIDPPQKPSETTTSPEPVYVPDMEANWPADAKVSLDLARTVKSSEGIPYLDIDPDKLTHMIREMKKVIAANLLTPERRDELTLKRDTAEIVLAIHAKATKA